MRAGEGDPMTVRIIVTENTGIYGSPTLGFARIAGYGLHWKHTGRHRLYYSERTGSRRPTWSIGPWWITVLHPGRER